MDGKVKIENGNIIVTDPVGVGNYASITPELRGKLYVNGILKKGKTVLKEEDTVLYEFEDEKECRELEVTISKDKMKVLLDVKIRAGKTFTLIDIDESNHIDVKVKEQLLEEPKMFSEKEINSKLKSMNINFGIDESVIKNLSNITILEPVVVAIGKEPVNAEDDSIKFFNKGDDKIVDDNSMENIDYRNVNKINSFNEGEVIGCITRGYDSQKGIDVYGAPVYAKRNRRKTITSGKGCTIKDNQVIATKGGQVSFKNGIVVINDAYTLNGDVDIKSGNVKFPGDVNVSGDCTEGMTVFALNNISIGKNAYKSNIIALGDININGAVINCKIVAGGDDVTTHERISKLKKLRDILEQLVQAIQCLEEKNVKLDHGLGTIVRTLIDAKFSDIGKICNEVMVSTIKAKDNQSQVLAFVRSKLMGNNVLNIEEKSEFVEAINMIDEELISLEMESEKSSIVTVNYCQESEINASGDINIKGKGVFSTNMISLGNIKFLDSQSVCRGGKLKAKKLIKASIVGSEGDVETILEVEDKKGEIFIDIAYNNTVIIIGGKTKIINKPSRNIHCYIDKSKQLTIDKFVL